MLIILNKTGSERQAFLCNTGAFFWEDRLEPVSAEALEIWFVFA
jgi:hypothetical protein